VKRRVIYSLLCALLGILFIASCKKDNPVAPLYFGYDYFPNNVGHYVIYNVDSNVADPYKTSGVDSNSYQIKEVIDSIYLDGSNRPTQRIVRYKRPNASSSWVLEKVWSGNLTKTDAEVVEDNIRYVKLTFPPNLNATWDGDGFNILGQQNYQYITVNSPLTVGGTNFDSTLTVLQDSTLTLVSHQFYEEIYATGVGLISKKIINLSDSGINPLLNNPYLQVNYSLLRQLSAGSTVYTETYVSCGN
jgi:hypothetical protein